jgi:hypothetical protein
MAPPPQARDVIGAPDTGNEIWLGDTYFPTVGPVRVTNITVTPQPVVFGDTTRRGDTQVMSQLVQSSAQGGSGIYKGDPRLDSQRAWTSQAETRFMFLTLPPLAVSIGKPGGAASTADPELMAEFNNELYVAWGSDLYRWLDGATAWSALDRALVAVPSDWREFRGKLYVAQGANLDVRDSAGAWTRQAIPATYLEIFQSKLWRLGLSAGDWTIYYSTDGAVWNTGGVLGASGATPNSLCVYRDAAGNRRLHVVTTRGLYVYDEVGNVWSQSDIVHSRADGAGKTARVWRDGKLYYPLGGLGMVQYQAGSPVAAQPVGLDRDDGVPTVERASFVALDADTNWLYAMLDGTVTQTSSAVEVSSGSGISSWQPGGEWDTATGVSTVRAWGGGPGWHRVWESGGSAYPGKSLLLSQAYNKKRLYIGADRTVFYIDQDVSLFNPRLNPTKTFAVGPVRHTTPWWFLSSIVQQNLVPHFVIWVRDATATESVDVYYSTDLDDNAWVRLATIASPGFNIVKLDNGRGSTGRWWRFALDLRRTATDNTKRPIVEFWGPQFMPLNNAAYGFAVEIDTTKPWRDKSPAQLSSALTRLCDPAKTPTLVEFAFQPDLEIDPQTYLVRPMRLSGTQMTGRKLRGQGRWLVSLVAPYSEDAL